jgi:hypothetical protein
MTLPKKSATATIGTWTMTVTLAGNNLTIEDEYDVLITLTAERGPALLAALSQVLIDREDAANWTVIGNTLHLGPTGSPWIAFPGDAGTAERIATTHNTIVEAFRAGAAHAATEIEAGQALADRLLAQLRLLGACPVCSRRMDPLVGVFQHASACALEAYETVRKARQ